MARRRDPIGQAVGKVTAALAALGDAERKAVLAAVNAVHNPPAPRRARAKKPAETGPQP